MPCKKMIKFNDLQKLNNSWHIYGPMVWWLACLIFTTAIGVFDVVLPNLTLHTRFMFCKFEQLLGHTRFMRIPNRKIMLTSA